MVYFYRPGHIYIRINDNHAVFVRFTFVHVRCILTLMTFILQLANPYNKQIYKINKNISKNSSEGQLNILSDYVNHKK